MHAVRCLLLSAFVTLPLAAFAQESVSRTDELRALEERLSTALASKDAATFDQLLAPDFVLRGAPDVPRETWVANALKLCWGDRYEIADFRLIGEAETSAVVSFALTTFQDPETCARATLRSLVTDVWRRGDDGWRLIMRHTGPAGNGLAQQFLREDAPPPLWERAADVSLVSTGGNTETRTLGLGGAVTWRPGAWRSDIRMAFVRSDTNDVRTAESLTVDARQSRTLGARLEAFARGTFLVNEFAGIDNRLTADAGLGVRLVERGAHRVRVDAGVGYFREARLAGATERHALGTLGGAWQWRVTGNTTVAEEASLNTSLDDLDDWGPAGTRPGQYVSDLAADSAALEVLARAGIGA
ncbi:MAG: DUF481 domain-containing protein, partial [Vicinamibacteria bacterium]